MSLRKNPRYDLRLKYKRTFETGIIISLVMIISAFKFFPKLESVQAIEFTSQELIKIEDVLITKQNETRVPPKPIPPVPIEMPDVDFEDPILEDTNLDLTVNVSKPVDKPENRVKVEEDKDNDYVFVVVEKMPEPIGGLKAIMDKVVYPELAIRAGIEGRVTVIAYVDESGNVYKTEVLFDIGGDCGLAAENAVKQIKFSPGLQRGNPVKVKIMVPIVFNLK